MIILSWLTLLMGLALSGWVFMVKVRGAFNYWIRLRRTAPVWVLGRTFKKEGESSAISRFLVDGNAFLRSIERSSKTVVRQWDHDLGTCFVGLVVKGDPGFEPVEDYELKQIPSQEVLRLSGTGRSTDQTPVEALKSYADQMGLKVDLSKPARWSGLSYSHFQWPVEADAVQSSRFGELAESTRELPDIIVFPVLLTIVALGLLGTGQPALFAVGIGLIVLVSGACKFVFIHQRSDESQEIHLQNY